MGELKQGVPEFPPLLTAAPICAAFCNRAVADMRAEEEEKRWLSFWKVVGVVELLEMEDENMDPADRFKGFGGIGIRSWGSVVNGSERMPGRERRRESGWGWKELGPLMAVEEAIVVAPWWALTNLLCSSAKASQNALWVIKLSLLKQEKRKKNLSIYIRNKYGNSNELILGYVNNISI